jgi:uncharacterized membrane protein
MSTSAPMIHNFGEAPLHVHVHLMVAVAAVAFGILIFLLPKGAPTHKKLGWIWVGLMLTAALSSFFIQARGHFSLIHVLSVVVLISVSAAVASARRGNIRLHKICMISTFSGLVIAGAFTLLPYRMLGKLAFG